MNSRKNKGDRAEREVEAIILDLLGGSVRRKLGAGRRDDIGDIDGVPDCTIAVRNWPSDTLRAVNELPLIAEQQRERAGTAFAAAFVRLRGGRYVVCLTPEQWSAYMREALPEDVREPL